MKHNRVLITGGTGSFGQYMTRFLLDTGKYYVRIFSRDEQKQEDMRRKFGNKNIDYVIGDAYDKTRDKFHRHGRGRPNIRTGRRRRRGGIDISRFGHMSRKDRERICIMCDSKCDVYIAEGRARFTPLKGHKLQNADYIWSDCKFYEEFKME